MFANKPLKELQSVLYLSEDDPKLFTWFCEWLDSTKLDENGNASWRTGPEDKGMILSWDEEKPTHTLEHFYLDLYLFAQKYCIHQLMDAATVKTKISDELHGSSTRDYKNILPILDLAIEKTAQNSPIVEIYTELCSKSLATAQSNVTKAELEEMVEKYPNIAHHALLKLLKGDITIRLAREDIACKHHDLKATAPCPVLTPANASAAEDTAESAVDGDYWSEKSDDYDDDSVQSDDLYDDFNDGWM
jgi:hypothetical protein